MGRGPGQRALRGGRESVEGEWYAVTVCGSGLELTRAASVIIETAKGMAEEGYIDLHAIVVMPDHTHLMFTLLGRHTLADLMRLFKGRSSRRANEALGRSGPLWQRAYYDRLVRTQREASAQWSYILENPVRRGLAEDWAEYPWLYTTAFP